MRLLDFEVLGAAVLLVGLWLELQLAQWTAQADQLSVGLRICGCNCLFQVGLALLHRVLLLEQVGLGRLVSFSIDRLRDVNLDLLRPLLLHNCILELLPVFIGLKVLWNVSLSCVLLL